MKNKRITNSFISVFLLVAMVVFLSMGFTGDDKKGNKKTTSKIYNPLKTAESGFQGDAYRLFINNINMPMNDRGKIADVNIPPDGTLGRFDGTGFLFSSGFMLSGYAGNQLWSNAVASASLVEDYVAGTVATDQNAGLYVVSRTDAPGSQAYIDWADAVALGADFVDVNGDGVYDPNVDMPDLLGDETVWSVFNDGVPSSQRRWDAISPLGIEVKQTAFALSSKGEIGNIIFLRYRIKYVGLGDPTEPTKMDSVYFGAWADPDIGGDAETDLVGSDVPRNAIYTYKDGTDPAYGSNPPAFIIDFFSGPIEYIPGETYTDNNGNGIYDDGVDDALDTAYSVRGQLKGVKEFPGARNQPLSSVVEYLNGFSAQFQDPGDHIEARNYMLGFDIYGEEVDPCTLPIGEVMGGVDCTTIDPRFWFSGDPITQTGWIGTQPWDVRMMSNTGPFTLWKDTQENRDAGRLIEKEIIVAYVVGRGTDNINSIAVARQIDDISQEIFDNNFPSPPPPPPMDYQVLTGEDYINLTWQTAPSISYRGIDTVLNYDRQVQGFYVTAFRTNSSEESINGIENSKIIAQYSVDNQIDKVYYTAPNGGIDLRIDEAPPNHQLDSLLYADPETGRITLTITQDPFTEGPLVKGKEYYFEITQYTLNHASIVNRETGTYGPPGDYLELGTAYEEYNQLIPLQEKHENQNRLVTIVFGEDLYDPAILPSDGNHIVGAADGDVRYLVVNKQNLTGDEYVVEFFPDDSQAPTEIYQPFWKLTNQTTGELLIDSSKIYNFDTTNYAGKVTDGFLVKVEDLVPRIDSTKEQVEYTGTPWYASFRQDSARGVFYVGSDIPQGKNFPVINNGNGQTSTAIKANKLRTIEIRFDPNANGKAYRYLHNYIGTILTQRNSYHYAEAVTAADTVGKGPVGMLGQGFVDVPFTVWEVDNELFGEPNERQLSVGFIEVPSTLGGNPDGKWDPGTTESPLGNECIIVFDADYDPNGGQILYTGNANGYANVVKGYTLDAPGATQEEIDMAASPWLNSLYVVGLKKQAPNTFFQPGENLTISVITYPYTRADQYAFTTTQNGKLTEAEKRALFDKVNVFPNPLYGFNSYTSNNDSPTDEPFVTFSNLPEEVTIKIFTLSGSLIRTLRTEDKSVPTSPFLEWDLLNEYGLRAASGLYIAIVSSPKYGDKILKFSIIMPQKQLQTY